MRWYRITACRDIPGQWRPRTEWDEIVVSGRGVAEAFDEVRRLGWWPTAVIKSDWEREKVD